MMKNVFRKNSLRFLMLAAVSCGFGAQRPAHAADATTPAGPSIDGFRSAKFGMSEAQVRSAIASDFNIAASTITEAENPVQRTTVLSVQVPNLVPGDGAPMVAYVLGYQSHKLMQVNIVWSPEIDPKTTPSMLYQNGQSLQQYFASEGFPANRSSGDIPMPDGEILFRATDTTGNSVGLILSATVTKDPKTSKSTVSLTGLTLTYAADYLHPDVFQLAKGSF
jgi:hypothetical protein